MHQKPSKDPPVDVPLLRLAYQRVLETCVFQEDAVSVRERWHVGEDPPFGQQSSQLVVILPVIEILPLASSFLLPQVVPSFGFLEEKLLELGLWREAVDGSGFTGFGVTRHEDEVGC